MNEISRTFVGLGRKVVSAADLAELLEKAQDALKALDKSGARVESVVVDPYAGMFTVYFWTGKAYESYATRSEKRERNRGYEQKND